MRPAHIPFGDPIYAPLAGSPVARGVPDALLVPDFAEAEFRDAFVPEGFARDLVVGRQFRRQPFSGLSLIVIFEAARIFCSDKAPSCAAYR